MAGTGDQVVIGVPRNEAFEDYCAERLGLGRAEILYLYSANGWGSLAARAAADEALIAQAALRARQAGGLNIVTYMGSGNVWRGWHARFPALRSSLGADHQPRLADR